MRFIFVLSGPIAAGKSSLCAQFRTRLNAHIVSTRDLLRERLAGGGRRSDLQTAGNQLDFDTGGQWVAEALRIYLGNLPNEAIVVLDCARTQGQLTAVRAMLGDRVRHVHLSAARFLREQRYIVRQQATFDETPFDVASADPTEVGIPSLAKSADLIIDTNATDAVGVFAQAVSGLGLVPGDVTQLVDVIVGAQYGSEGKGNICAHLAKDYDVLMRVGGPNAGHMVAEPRYKYVQLPSGTQSHSSAKILIGSGATLWLPQVLKEISDCKLTGDRLSIDPQAMMIEPLDQEMEAASMEVIGSTKQGVGVATARKILGRGGGLKFGSPARLAGQVAELKDFIRCTKRELEKAYASGHRIMLEGTQGTDLSLHHGQYPFVTSRETTASGCLADAGIAPRRVRKVIMVTRTYPIRVGGTSGPMMREIDAATISHRSGVPIENIQKTEVGTVSGKSRRIGEFDWEQLRRAAVLNGATDIAMTFVDYLNSANAKATTFGALEDRTKAFLARVANVANAPVSLISVGFGTPVIENGYRR